MYVLASKIIGSFFTTSSSSSFNVESSFGAETALHPATSKLVSINYDVERFVFTYRMMPNRL